MHSKDWVSDKDALAATILGDGSTAESKDKIYGVIGSILSDFNNPREMEETA